MPLCSPEFRYYRRSDHWAETACASKESYYEQIFWALVSSQIHSSTISHFIPKCLIGTDTPNILQCVQITLINRSDSSAVYLLKRSKPQHNKTFWSLSLIGKIGQRKGFSSSSAYNLSINLHPSLHSNWRPTAGLQHFAFLTVLIRDGWLPSAR